MVEEVILVEVEDMFDDKIDVDVVFDGEIYDTVDIIKPMVHQKKFCMWNSGMVEYTKNPNSNFKFSKKGNNRGCIENYRGL